MKKLLMMFAVTLSLFGAELVVDKDASSIKFEATKMLFIGVDGNFSDFSGSVTQEGDAITAIEGTISVFSIDTDNKKRDDHLLSSDFFDEVAFKEIHFKSVKMTADRVDAEITIKDVTKVITFKLEQIQKQGDGVELHLSGVVDRTDFGIDNNFMSMMIFDNIDVNAIIVAK